MSSIEFVEIDVARAASGVRIVVSGAVPSPWSEAAKGLFLIARVPVLAVRSKRGSPEITAWTGVDNVPAVFHASEPVRTTWAPITTLAARLAGPGVLLPDDLAARSQMMGLLHEVAGEDGIGWNARLAMIHASLVSEGTRGFPLPVAQYLAPRYGYATERMIEVRSRIETQLGALGDALGAGAYFGGTRPSALDVYCATFLTPLTAIPEDDCPALSPRLRLAFGSAHEELGSLVPAHLLAHRTRMFERHLAWPIAL